MRDFVWAVWLGFWNLLKMFWPALVLAIPLAFFDCYIPGSLAIIGLIMGIVILLYIAGSDFKT